MKLTASAVTASRSNQFFNWCALFMLAAAISQLLTLINFPAAALLGSMLAGVCFAVSGNERKLWRPLFLLAQGVAGCLIATNLTPVILLSVIANWPILLLSVCATLLFSFCISWGLRYFGKVSAETAIWAAMPGMSSAMVIIAYERNADGRVVALVQYIRLAAVVLAVTLVSHLFATPAAVISSAKLFSFTPIALSALCSTLAIAALGPLAARYMAFLPAAAMMVPLIVGAVLSASNIYHMTLPGWVLNLAFAAIGLEVGLKFTRAILLRLIRLIPLALLASLALIGLSALFSLLLSYLMGVDLLTAFLATVPGSIDSVAIVAIASHVDVTFVLALQTVRMFVVVLGAPFFVRQLRRLPGWEKEEQL
ncbi:membrane AbrB-like protein [Erwinia toletana]|uniref:Membrane AbrB-like protein n=1 Tax=Winslowiella toletana TaxID=92490 RepID=A0ABS4PBL6_9GAMM|nr:AbrB family transcriptional regulator [Winslowiella toletana]MBP2170028.1 membrane AbrB-like protein [Winslowiella toletana]